MTTTIIVLATLWLISAIGNKSEREMNKIFEGYASPHQRRNE